MASTSGNTRDLRSVAQVIEERPFITERWLRRIIYERRIPHYKLGRRVFVDLTDLDAYLDAGRVPAEAS